MSSSASRSKHVSSSSSESIDLARLILGFLASERSEAAFAEIVRSLGGLVYSSALRRTGNPSLAEEISQNVFALLARKARALAKHPAPLAWVFQTTKFEAAKAMRSEKRHQRKQAALAREQLGMLATADEAGDESWRDALPHLDESLDELSARDRELVLQRYVHQRKFREMAATTGQSEAACKMRVRRALDKLARLLTSRGVALSTTAIGSLLASEMAKATPLSLVSASGEMLAASQSVTASTILVHTLQTMSAAKSITISATAVVLLAAGPAALQHSQAKALARDVDRLEAEHTVLSAAAEMRRRDSASARNHQTPTGARTVAQMMPSPDSKVDPDSFMYDLIEVVSGQDTLGMLRVFLVLSKMSTAEVNELIDAIDKRPAPDSVKKNALRMLAEFSPASNPRDTLERAIKLGIDPQTISRQLGNWAAKEPQAALAWFRENAAAGRLEGKQLRDNPPNMLYAELIGGIAVKDPKLAISLFAEADLDEQTMSARNLTEAFLRSDDPSGFREQIGELLKHASDARASGHIINAATLSLQRKSGPEDALALLDHLDPQSKERAGALAGLATDFGLERQSSVTERADWLLRHTTPDTVQLAVKGFVEKLTWRGNSGLDEWITSQPSGAIRDTAWSSRAVTQSNNRRHDAALQAALRVEASEKRQETLQQIALYWEKRDRPGARTAFIEAGLDPAAYGLEKP